MNKDFKDKYYLAVNYGFFGGWSLEPFEHKENLIKAIQEVNKDAFEWKVLKELKFDIKEE